MADSTGSSLAPDQPWEDVVLVEGTSVGWLTVAPGALTWELPLLLTDGRTQRAVLGCVDRVWRERNEIKAHGSSFARHLEAVHYVTEVCIDAYEYPVGGDVTVTAGRLVGVCALPPEDA